MISCLSNLRHTNEECIELIHSAKSLQSLDMVNRYIVTLHYVNK